MSTTKVVKDPWDDLVRHTAFDLIDRALAEDWFTPEGLELYKWYWVPSSWYTFKMTVPYLPALVLSEPEPYAPLTLEVRPIIRFHGELWPHGKWHGGVGWDVDARVAVLFFVDGGRLVS